MSLYVSVYVCMSLVYREYRTYNWKAAGSTLTWSTASNTEQAVNLLSLLSSVEREMSMVACP